MHENIVIRGARTHNLKNLTLSIPRNKMVVITGLSGSGKSSLAFDTLYAEGQRRYVESLSAYARQFLERMQKPDVDSITGISPAVAIERRRQLAAALRRDREELLVLFAVYRAQLRNAEPKEAQPARNPSQRLHPNHHSPY